MVSTTTPSPSASSTRRLAFLDALRGIAAFSVAIQHGAEVIFGHGFRNWSNHWFGFGKFGLIAFFITSGFIIPYSLERGASAARFWVGRFFRLYPAYWVSLALVLVLWGLGYSKALPPAFARHIPINTVANVTMLQDYVGRPHAIPLYYTLSIELFFYASCTVLYLIGLHKRSVLNAYACLALTAFGGLVLPLALGHRMPFAGMVYLSAMFTGTVLFRASRGTIRWSAAIGVLATNAVVVSIGAWINFSHFRGGGPSFGLEPGGQANVMSTLTAWGGGYLLFLLGMTGVWRWFPRPIRWLGLISYSVYLMHPVLLAVTRGRDIPDWLALGLMLGGTLVLSAITYRFVERPMIDLGRRIQDRRWPMHQKRPRPVPA
jgi:peptidoglycan/LPS O-acetylase OafA/YrhL